MAKILCVLFDDPTTGMPESYARDTVPDINGYPGGQTLPTPHAVDFKPGQMLGSVSGELGLRKFLEVWGINWSSLQIRTALTPSLSVNLQMPISLFRNLFGRLIWIVRGSPRRRT